MHGAGNDFVIIDLRNSESPTPELCRALANRHTGIGCDMILGINASKSAEAIVSYEIWTADGLPSMQCGNGARCVAAWVVRAGLVQGSFFALDSPSGTHVVQMLDITSFRIAMGIPQFALAHISLLKCDEEKDIYEVDLENNLKICFSAVLLGNPHAVIQVNDITTAQVTQIGPILQTSRFFLPTVNVGFSEIVSRKCIKLRVYEYGAGETLACGSGACAAAAALMQQGLIDRSVSVVLPGGELHIDWLDSCKPIMMTGPATFVFEGEFYYASIQQYS